MSSNQEMSDADKVSLTLFHMACRKQPCETEAFPPYLLKIRAKRIAAMQRSMAQSQNSPAPSASSEPASTSQPQPQQRSESALNRLMATSTPSPPAPSAASKGSAKPASSSSLASTPSTSVRASPVPAVTRPIRNYTITPAKPAAAVAVKRLAYEEWETDKVGEVLGVCLTVSFQRFDGLIPFVQELIGLLGISDIVERGSGSIWSRSYPSIIPRTRTVRISSTVRIAHKHTTPRFFAHRTTLLVTE
jgi:hypothetical protein